MTDMHVVVSSVHVDGNSTINEREPRMTKKKPLPAKSEQKRPTVKVHTAVLRNQAMHTEAPDAAVPDVAILRITGLFAQLSPANRQLAENIIRCVLDDQMNDKA